ncbi:MAG: DUF1926 domain-containing protein [Candidatus Desulfofervidaceae bacterium]|nr:DUF1926 domain-containing protein [Candidatus Desulfofervidaceae bacterium]
MPRYFLPFAVHNHQPVGNFDKVFKKALNECYAPFLEIAKNFPYFRFSLHFSGCLLEWLEQHAPAIIDLIGELVTRKQIELMAGGFYEPLLPFVPERDARAQLEHMIDYLKRRFGVVPEGLWLAERVWTPDLPKLLAPLGIKYTLVDDAHFLNAGLEEKQIHGYFITEKEGHSLFVFPISKELRYLIPFKSPEELLDYFQHFFASGHGNTLTYGDDGEKFGLWPETKKWVYEQGWLKRFLQFLEEHQDEIQVLPLNEFVATHPPQGRIYLPPASYEEMMEWTLMPDAALKYEHFIELLKSRHEWETFRPFVRGGIWDNFLRKYEESNLMHKKMIYVSQKVARVYNQYDPSHPPPAVRALWRGQCNCAYWHGVFGGLYLGHLRGAVYKHLIAAEKQLPQTGIESVLTDYDCDGHLEWIFSGAKFNAYFKPRYGGTLVELDLREKEVNLTNVLTRRQEAYHEKIRELIHQTAQEEDTVKTIHEQFKLKEPDLDKYLIYDWHHRYSFLDHFLGEEVDLAKFSQAAYYDLGNFTIEPYSILLQEKDKATAVLKLERKGFIQGKEPLTIIKKFTLNDTQGNLKVEYTFIPSFSASLTFATEMNFHLPGWQLLVNNKSYDAVKTGQIERISHFLLKGPDPDLQIEITAQQAFDLWFFPVETVNFSESGAERTYQGTCLVFIKRLKLEKEKETKIEWELKIK